MKNQKRKALVVVNPKSGRIRVKSQVLDITRLSTSGIAPTVYTTTARGDATKYVEDMGEDYDMIICRGGDGTFNEVVNGIMRLENKKCIGYIPAGTTNDLSRVLGIPNNTRKAMELIIAGNTMPHDIGLFNNERYFTYIASFGAFTKAAYATPQVKKNSMGYFAYLLEAVNCIKDIKPIHARVVVDGKELEDNYVYGAVSNSTSVGGVLKLDMNIVDLTDGIFEVMLVKNPGSVKRWKDTLYAAKSRRYEKSECIDFFQGRKIEFFFDKEIPFTTDGEYINGGKRVVIENRHKAIYICR